MMPCSLKTIVIKHSGVVDGRHGYMGSSYPPNFCRVGLGRLSARNHAIPRGFANGLDQNLGENYTNSTKTFFFSFFWSSPNFRTKLVKIPEKTFSLVFSIFDAKFSQLPLEPGLFLAIVTKSLAGT